MNTCVNDGSGGMNDVVGITGTSPTNTDITVFYTDFGGASDYAPSNGTPVAWDGILPATNTNVYSDVNGDGSCDVLRGYNEWLQSSPTDGVYQDVHFQLSFQCNTGFWDDGAQIPAQVEGHEMTIPDAIEKHRLHGNR